MCHLFNVKHSGFYDYLKNRMHRKNELEEELIDWMKKISESSHFSYGSRRMTKALNALGYRIPYCCWFKKPLERSYCALISTFFC